MHFHPWRPNSKLSTLNEQARVCGTRCGRLIFMMTKSSAHLAIPEYKFDELPQPLTESLQYYHYICCPSVFQCESAAALAFDLLSLCLAWFSLTRLPCLQIAAACSSTVCAHKQDTLECPAYSHCCCSQHGAGHHVGHLHR